MNSVHNNIDFIARSPGGVALLRKLVLELAVRGKLVSQDPKDEPASVLLERIKREKARLMKEGKIKTGKELPEIKEEEKPYELPKKWEWVRVRDITHDWGQKTPDKDFTYIDVASIDNKAGKLSPKTEILSAKEAPSRARKIVKVGSVIYSTVRPYLLNTAIIENPISPEPIASTAFAILHPYSYVSSQYLHLYLRSQSFTDYVSEKMIGMAYPAINDSQFSNGVIALPPITEQSRIVARVQELMAVLDHLEDQTYETEGERNRALIATTQAVSQAATDEEIASSWLRLAIDLDRLVDRAEDVKTIRAMVLELAVRGKLVPQDPKDELASVLLDRIKWEKTRLVKEEEKPYKLPRGWVWIRFSSIGDCRLGKMLDEQKNTGKLVPYLRNSNVQWGHFDLSDVKNIRLSSKELIEYQILKNDLLICEGGEPGRCAIWENDDGYITFQKALHRYRPYEFTNVRYIEILLKKLAFTGELATFFTGATIKHLTGQSLERILIPLPPYAEQSRIVSRFLELFTAIDRLEGKLVARDKVAVFASESIVKMNQA